MNSHNLLFIRALFISFTALASASTLAGKIYMWHDSDNVPHYGETPPQGVKAVLISETNDKKSKKQTAHHPSPADNVSDQKKALLAKRDKECADEKSRLATLQNNGSRIRMSGPDGNSRYLSPEEIDKEINSSKEFLKNACGAK